MQGLQLLETSLQHTGHGGAQVRAHACVCVCVCVCVCARARAFVSQPKLIHRTFCSSLFLLLSATLLLSTSLLLLRSVRICSIQQFLSRLLEVLFISPDVRPLGCSSVPAAVHQCKQGRDVSAREPFRGIFAFARVCSCCHRESVALRTDDSC